MGDSEKGKCIKGDCENGWGVEIHSDGAIYEGEFKRGKPEGKGIKTYPNGKKKEGIFLQGNLFMKQDITELKNEDKGKKCQQINLPKGTYYANFENHNFYRSQEDCVKQKGSIGLFLEHRNGYRVSCNRYGFSDQPTIIEGLKWVLKHCPAAKTIKMDEKDKNAFFEKIDREIGDLEHRIRLTSSSDEQGRLLKRKAELIYEKSVINAGYLSSAIDVMQQAQSIFKQTGNDILLSQTLTALGNLNKHMNRPKKSYDYYEKAAKVAKGKDFKSYLQASMNQCVLCCERIIENDIRFVMLDRLSEEGMKGDSCCYEKPKKLAEEAARTGNIELEFIAYRQFFGILSAVVESREEGDLNNDIRNRVAGLAFRLLMERDKSYYDTIAVKTLLDRAGEIITNLSVPDHEKVINWLSGSFHRIYRLNNPEHIFKALLFLGTAQETMGKNPEKAVENLSAALLLGIQLKKDDKILNTILGKVIDPMIALGKYEDALGMTEIAIRLKQSARQNPCGTYMIRGNIFDIQGKYVDAIREYIKAREMAANGGNLYDMAHVEYNMSFTYQNIGEYARAKGMLLKSLSIFGRLLEEKIGFKEKHPIPEIEGHFKYFMKKDLEFFETLTSKGIRLVEDQDLFILLNDIWNCYSELAKIDMKRGDIVAAKENYMRSAKWFQRATQIHYYSDKKVYGDPTVTIGLAKLAMIDGDFQTTQQYLNYYDEKDRNTKIFNLPNFKLERILVQGEMEYGKGELEKSEKTFLEAVRLAEMYGFDVEKSQALAHLAFTHAALKKMKEAYETFLNALQLEDAILKSVLFSASEQAKLDFIKSYNDTFHAFMSFIRTYFKDDTHKIKEAFTVLETRKGIVFEAQTRVMETLRKSLDTKIKKDLDHLTKLRSEIAKLLIGKTNLPLKETERLIAQYKEKASAIEKDLINKSSHLALQFHSTIPKSATLAKALPERGALVEFIHFPEYDYKNRKWSKEMFYLVFILDKSRNVRCIDLGDGHSLDDLTRKVIHSIRRDLKSINRGKVVQLKEDRTVGKSETSALLSLLYKRIWLPINRKLGNTSICFISPDGLLNLLPFAALKTPEQKYLIEEQNIVYVSVGKDLLNKIEKEPSEIDLMLIANPDFDRSPSLKTIDDESSLALRLRSRSSIGKFNPLPGTEKEAVDIPLLFEKGNKKVLTGPVAKETSVKKAKGMRVLHLATHGFFLESSHNEISKKTEIANRKIDYFIENPLLRSGLAFAGANHATVLQSEDDGILTAFEMTGLNLYNTDLVTLSACETGIGEVISGEGVFGLRRAFALSGAKNTVMSLWPVSDQFTSEHMIDFYRYYANGKTPMEALRQSQIIAINELRKIYNNAPVCLWAPFILQVSSL